VLLSGSLARSPSEEGETIHFLIKDIEQRRLMQKQMAQADKLASIGELSSGIAHEINNPLGIILGYTQLLLRSEVPQSDRYNDLKTIEKHVQSCKAIVEDLLNFARTSSPRKAKLDIHSRDRRCHRLRPPSQQPGKHSDQTVFEPDVPPVLMDEKKIKQVLINLLMNAIHAVARNGTIKITTGLNGATGELRWRCRIRGMASIKKICHGSSIPFSRPNPPEKARGLDCRSAMASSKVMAATSR
jgi:two-component system NtrC family sensor kinase